MARDVADADGGKGGCDGRPREREDGLVVRLLHGERRALAPVPQDDRVVEVGAHRREALARGREGEAADAAGVLAGEDDGRVPV